MTDEIRRKHENFKRRLSASEETKNIRAAHLSIANVDALFRALDAERGKVDRALSAITDTKSAWHIVYKNTIAALTREK
jgi:hypothetical protein